MICFPNAKINIGLFVTEKRSDGYHNLETIFYPIPLKDALEIIPSAQTDMITHGLNINGNPQDNLVWKAWALLQKDFPEKVPGITIHLLKKIPMGAGMGGGSSDGAHMLQLLNKAFALQLSVPQLMDYALQLGSDCPFFIHNQACFAKGRGEQLSPVSLDLKHYSLQIICPSLHIATAVAFSQLQPKAAAYDLSTIASLPIDQWKNHVFNDFEPAIFAAYPLLKNIKDTLYEQGAVYAAMSGTGSTLYGIFEKGKKANIGADTAAEQYYFE
ncbi:4-(cytidine 5'-diphospho)-2-C-methyl-D-erythritol kinase [Taibaiella sp. KBW10]|uniref:4-(cytidine 5'-diphospho)-2-C-methyl-D-erythritol kinase n=1 Tax=Taibaiella sp. KBW10 TaxID=2153357 RepID=UPI000F5AB031|nr:4-(cytidine 5'-diphospho)-2-C-methyl-D-erythritol kinase [Taibaiella sp. KBW10]RQO30350.1 4-(cytidine 5'-diphospho)-2-C-methyl-D-erythritol kinase [Taibaiella sp. KBW10]